MSTQRGEGRRKHYVREKNRRQRTPHTINKEEKHKSKDMAGTLSCKGRGLGEEGRNNNYFIHRRRNKRE